MNNKTLMIMLAIFIVLGTIVYVLEQPFTEKKTILPPELGVMFPDFKADEIMKMEFGSFSSKTILVRENDAWWVMDKDQKFPCDQSSIDKVFETIQAMDAKQIISTNPGKHMSFEVNSPQETQATDSDGEAKPFNMGTLGTEVILKDGTDAEKVHFFVGKNSSGDFMTTYVRKDKTDAVVLVDGYLKMVFSKPDAAGWKDRNLSKIEKTELTKITLVRGKEQLVFESSSPEAQPVSPSEDQPTSPPQVSPAAAPEWMMTSPPNIETDPKQIDRLVTIFANLQATDFAPAVTDPSEYGFDPPEIKVVLNKMDGSEITLLFGKESNERKDQFFAKIEGSDRVYIVPKYRMETLRKKPTEFGPAAAPASSPPPPVGVSGPLNPAAKH